MTVDIDDAIVWLQCRDTSQSPERRMPIVMSYDEIAPDRIRRNPGGPDRPASTNYPFFRAAPDTPDAPTAFLAQYDPGDHSCTHFHEVDQFQILVKGKGTLGRHHVEPYYVHFARAYTPYGPLHADDETGWTFMTLRTRYDPGAQRLPGALPKLQQVRTRKPWQVTSMAQFAARGTGVSIQENTDIKDERGLYVRTVTMAPGTSLVSPSPAEGAGQYIVAVKGALVHENRAREALAVVFNAPQEAPFRIQAGDEGLQALIVNFPRAEPIHAGTGAASTAVGYRKWQCVLCGFIYDEAAGLPDEGIAPGTHWADVPASWVCGDCGATKGEFEMMEL
jgi:rubredoxin